MVDPSARPALVLVHGAWHGSWCWERLIPELTARGWAVSAVDLPSASPGGERFGMDDDARVIRDHLRRIDGPVVLLAHSYGGVPATEAAAAAPDVVQLVYLAALVIEQGKSVMTSTGRPPLPVDQETVAPPADPAVALYSGVPAELAARALARLGTQSARSFNGVLTSAAWEEIPSVYLVCEQDRMIPPALQESMATRVGTVRRLPTGHSPFLSHPAELADLLTEIAPAGPR